jgi:hypothetical protein
MPVTVYVPDEDDIADRVGRIIRVRDGVDLTEYVRSAQMLIVGRAQPAGYSQGEMEFLHVWLSAHFYEVDYQRKFEQKIGEARDKPETKVDLGLMLTRPGQQVLVLDYLHAFSDLDPTGSMTMRRPRVKWVGKPREAF